MEGANVEVDEAAEERKGGAGDLGKVLAACPHPTTALVESVAPASSV